MYVYIKKTFICRQPYTYTVSPNNLHVNTSFDIVTFRGILFLIASDNVLSYV